MQCSYIHDILFKTRNDPKASKIFQFDKHLTARLSALHRSVSQ